MTEEFGGSCDGFENEVEHCNNGECPARKINFQCIMCIYNLIQTLAESNEHILISNK